MLASPARRSASGPTRNGYGHGEYALVVSLLLAFRGLARTVAAVWHDPQTKALPFVAGGLVLTGTIVYWRFEDWTIIQSLYFSVVTLTTVGYGDFTPTSAGAQIFTIIYILTGVGVFVALLASVAAHYIAQRTEDGSARDRLRARHRTD
jgi:voltage-gated potassium channel